MHGGFDEAPSRFKEVSVERAITMLTHFRIQLVEIDPENPRGLWFTFDNGQTLAITPKGHRLNFTLADPPVV